MVVDPRRDHGMRVPRPDLAEALGTPDACTGCHRDRSADWAASRVRDWLGRDAHGFQRYAVALRAADTGAVGAGALLRALAADAAQPAIARASALARLDASEDPASGAALVAALRDASPLVRLGALQGLESAAPDTRAAAAASLSDPLRVLRFEATRVLASAAPGLSPEQRASFERSASEYVAALHLDADRAEARAQLAAFLAQRGDLAGARAELRAATAIEPGFAPAWVNLADLERAAGREDEARIALGAGLAAQPDSAVLHHAQGLALVRGGLREAALGALARAVELEPHNTRFGFVYAIALHDAGRVRDAIAALEVAHRGDPGDRDVLGALAAFHGEAGDASAASRYRAELDRLGAVYR
jgi:predicted Zn-dependent protease